MSIAKDIYDIGKDISNVRSKYKKTHAKEEYINLMENQLDNLLILVNTLKTKLEQFD